MTDEDLFEPIPPLSSVDEDGYEKIPHKPVVSERTDALNKVEQEEKEDDTITFASDFEDMLNKRQRNLDGKYNCIPLSFPRFKKVLPGFERGKYVLVTALEKIGKSKLVDYLLVYSPLFYMVDHPELHMKILYFTLEVSAKSKRYEFYCHLLWRLDKIHIDTKTLNSIEEGHPLDDRIITLLKSPRYQKYIKMYKKMVTYIDTVKNPTGVHKLCRDYARDHGHFVYKNLRMKENGKKVEKQVIDYHVWDDEECYYTIILDNMANLSSENGMKPMETIVRMSKYFIELRNHYDYLIVAVQHQAQQSESNESFKLGRTMASSANMGNAKETSRDLNLSIGLNSPFKLGLKDCEGYDIKKLKNNFRLLNIIDDRDYGASGMICPLFFDGAVSEFKEMPLPTDEEGLKKVYNHIEKINNDLKFNEKLEKALSLSLMAVNFYRKRIVKSFARENVFTYLRKTFHKLTTF